MESNHAQTPPQGCAEQPQPPRVLGGMSSFAVVAGSMLGIGIFLAPPIVARLVESPLAFYALWVVGGLTALGGAVACAELATMFPRCGGDYVFQREAFGPSVAFASGWVLLAAVFAGSIASIAVGLCTYQLPTLLGVDLAQPLWLGPFGLRVTPAQLLGIGLVLALTGVNHLGARPAGWLQMVTTLVPVGLLLVGAVYVLGFSPLGRFHEAAPPLTQGFSWLALVGAYLPIYFAFSGWNSVIYLAGEVQRPNRNLPRGLVLGTLVVTGLYLLMCSGFLQALGLGGLREVGEAGSASALAVGGRVAELAVTVCVAITMLACLNGSILGSARVAFAMGQGGAFWRRVGVLNSRRGVPGLALWLQAGWSSVLILSNSFEQILNLVSVAMLLSGSLTVASLFVLRRRQPHAPRPFMAWGYPVLPLLYLISSGAVIGALLYKVFTLEPGALYPLFGLGILGVTYLAHRLRPGRSTGQA
ncbi:MAG TPA: APC family permease [Myxococcota bacterium]|nr:APC family permease [Myxococcota bacterium]HRY95498.1 APC family permease [Myxococcota bacterium]HSA23385.1 APC family permease [Myxococcota bacterium]